MKKTNKQGEDKGKDAKTRRRPLRLVTTTLSIVIILWLTMVVYEKFGVGDSNVWVQDVLTLLLILVLIFLAAVGVVGLLMLVRKLRS